MRSKIFQKTDVKEIGRCEQFVIVYLIESLACVQGGYKN